MDSRARYIRTGLAALALLAAAVVMGSASSTQPLKLLALIGGLGVVYVCLFHRWWGVILLLGMAPFYGFIRYVLDIPPTWALYKEGMVVLIVAGWLVEDVVLRRKPYAQNALTLPLGVFLFVLLVQFLRAPDPVQAVFGLRVYVTYIPIFYVMLTEQPDDRQVKAAFGVIIAATALTLVYGLWQWTVGLDGLQGLGLDKAGPNIAAMGFLRVFSTYAGPEYFAVNLVFNIMLLMGVIITRSSAGAKIAAIAGVALMLFLLALTLYRSIWGMCLLGFVTLLLITRKYRYALLLVLVPVVMILTIPPYIKERLTTTFSRDDISYQIRKDLYLKTNVSDIVENVAGYGVGSAVGADVFQMRTGRRSMVRLLGGGSTESWLASLTIELGVLGLVAYLWLMIAIARTALAVYRQSPPGLWQAVGMAFASFTVSMLIVSSFFLVPACFPAADLYFWFTAGLIAVKSSQLPSHEIHENLRDLA